jgi:hypothetical protein
MTRFRLAHILWRGHAAQRGGATVRMLDPRWCHRPAWMYAGAVWIHEEEMHREHVVSMEH